MNTKNMSVPQMISMSMATLNKIKDEIESRKIYDVWNCTDDIPASMDSMCYSDAEQFVKDYPKRYEKQGYYFTNQMERINPNDVVLEIRRREI